MLPLKHPAGRPSDVGNDVVGDVRTGAGLCGVKGQLFGLVHLQGDDVLVSVVRLAIPVHTQPALRATHTDT